MIIGNTVGGYPLVKSFILETEDGKQIPAVLTNREVVFDATKNDIRMGKTAATGEGVTVGEKVIPGYQTTYGSKYIRPGESMNITILTSNNEYDYTKIQATICLFNNTSSDSVATEMVIINDKVYNVRSVDAISSVTKNHEKKTIELGITNNFDVPCIIRYLSYKEIE